MRFNEITAEFEKDVLAHEQFELLEAHEAPYAFGSGFAVYRVRGKNLRLVWDGKEHILEVHISPTHVRYPHDSWNLVWHSKAPIVDSEGRDHIKTCYITQ